MKYLKLIVIAAIMASATMNAHSATTDYSSQTPQVIAHRGFWKSEGAVQNSRASLKAALALGVFGSETDVWITTDGHLMVNHDSTFDGVRLQDESSDVCAALTLGNGEKMPQLFEELAIMSETESPTKLILEVKDHGNKTNDVRAAKAAVAAVRAAGLQDRVDYISFSTDACETIIAEDPDARVGYLKGGIAPAELHKKGYSSIAYHMNELRNNPTWVKDAHDLGMKVNVWTVNTPEEMIEMRDKGVDYITTDDPLTLISILEK